MFAFSFSTRKHFFINLWVSINGQILFLLFIYTDFMSGGGFAWNLVGCIKWDDFWLFFVKSNNNNNNNNNNSIDNNLSFYNMLLILTIRLRNVSDLLLVALILTLNRTNKFLQIFQIFQEIHTMGQILVV